jgi:uncharacterized membrane protein HdeD (DUF308 family)
MKKIKASEMLLITATAFILIGLCCFINPLRAYVWLVKLSGLILILHGVVLQIASSSTHLSFISEKRAMRIESIFDFIFGMLLLFNPFLTFVLYPMLIGYWILCIGLVKISISLLMRKKIRKWLFILAIGLIAVAFGIGIINAPSTRAKDITLVIGAFFVILGSVLLYDGVKLKRMHETVDLLF